MDRGIMAQSIPSVPIPPPPPPGICHFVFKIMQMPHGGAGKTPKLYFQVNKLKIPYLWEISNNLIKTSGAPYANL